MVSILKTEYAALLPESPPLLEAGEAPIARQDTRGKRNIFIALAISAVTTVTVFCMLFMRRGGRLQAGRMPTKYAARWPTATMPEIADVCEVLDGGVLLTGSSDAPRLAALANSVYAGLQPQVFGEEPVFADVTRTAVMFVAPLWIPEHSVYIAAGRVYEMHNRSAVFLSAFSSDWKLLEGWSAPSLLGPDVVLPAVLPIPMPIANVSYVGPEDPKLFRTADGALHILANMLGAEGVRRPIVYSLPSGSVTVLRVSNDTYGSQMGTVQKFWAPLVDGVVHMMHGLVDTPQSIAPPMLRCDIACQSDSPCKPVVGGLGDPHLAQVYIPGERVRPGTPFVPLCEPQGGAGSKSRSEVTCGEGERLSAEYYASFVSYHSEGGFSRPALIIYHAPTQRAIYYGDALSEATNFEAALTRLTAPNAAFVAVSPLSATGQAVPVQIARWDWTKDELELAVSVQDHAAPLLVLGGFSEIARAVIDEHKSRGSQSQALLSHGLGTALSIFDEYVFYGPTPTV